VVQGLEIASMVRPAKPVPDPDNPGQFLGNGARPKSGLSRSSSDAARASSSQYCALKRRTLDAY